MDNEKAIDFLKADKEYLTDMKICDGEEMDIAIKALEKQIPKKPFMYGIEEYMATCPNCNKWLEVRSCKIFCPYCGQMIDWID